MAKHGKKYRDAKAKVVKPIYSISEAIVLLKETNTTKFDASCEIHIRLGVDPKHADQIVRSTIMLPHGTGKTVRVVAIVSDDKVDEAIKAGAIDAGNETIIAKIEKGWTDFDMVVAMPALMAKLGKVAKTLGQQGLMPSPKAGTVTPEPAKIIEQIMKGKIEFRTDKTGIIHNIFGKVSFANEKLEENLKALLKAILDAKPSGAKGTYVKAVHLTTSMGPSVMIETQEVMAL